MKNTRAYMIESRLKMAMERFVNHKATPQMLAQVEATVRDELLHLMREGELWDELGHAIRRTGITHDGNGSFTVQLDPVLIAYLRGLKDA